MAVLVTALGVGLARTTTALDVDRDLGAGFDGELGRDPFLQGGLVAPDPPCSVAP